jgi:hypothetical protein
MKTAASGLAILSLALSLAQGFVSVANARPLTPAEQRYSPFSGVLPFCDHSKVLDEINFDFRARESEYWKSGLTMVTIDHVREIGYRATGVDYIPRRYCKALVYFSDQKAREMSYSIVESGGPIGIGWGTNWCISGLDRNYAYGLDCRSARP